MAPVQANADTMARVRANKSSPDRPTNKKDKAPPASPRALPESAVLPAPTTVSSQPAQPMEKKRSTLSKMAIWRKRESKREGVRQQPEGSGVVRVDLRNLDHDGDADPVDVSDPATPPPTNSPPVPTPDATVPVTTPGVVSPPPPIGFGQLLAGPAPARKPKLGFKSDRGVLDAIQKYGRSYSDEEVTITFAELYEIDARVGVRLQDMRAEGLITYEADGELLRIRVHSPRPSLPPPPPPPFPPLCIINIVVEDL